MEEHVAKKGTWDDYMTFGNRCGYTVAKVESTADDSRGVKFTDVRSFFQHDVNMATARIKEHAELRCEELQQVFDEYKEELLKSIEAEKENMDVSSAVTVPDPTPALTVSTTVAEAYDIIIQATKGPYRGNDYILRIDMHRKKNCWIGRSTGKRFRLPHGLSLPKDFEISTSHAELRMEKDGCVYFSDCHSTNGSYVNGEAVEPSMPYALDVNHPTTLTLGGTELILSLAARE